MNSEWLQVLVLAAITSIFNPPWESEHKYSSPTTMSSDRKQVVVLYAEAKLQKSMNLPGSLTVAQAKEEGMVAIRDHLNALPGVPPVSLDPDCTDFYPGTSLLPADRDDTHFDLT